MKIKKNFGNYFLVIVICGILLPLGFTYLTHSQGKLKKNSHNNSTITKGFWTYSITITNPGTRSEGSLGKLFYKNKPLPLPENLSDFYETPLGRFSYVGTDGNLWDDKGWILNTGNVVPSGNALLHPDGKTNLVIQAKQNMDMLIQTIRQKSEQPEYFDEIEFESAIKEKDPWGVSYRIFIDRRGGEGPDGVVRLILKSAGPDKQFGSEDDIEEHSNFFSIPKDRPHPGSNEMLLEAPPISEEPS